MLKDLMPEHLDQILEGRALPLVASRNGWITSHDLALALKKLKECMDDFGDAMIAATNKLEDVLKED